MWYRRQKRYFIHIRALKQALNHGLILKRVHRVIQFNQKAWLKPYIDMNAKLIKEAKNEFEKDFFKLMNNSVFGKTMENVRKHRDIKLVTTDEKRNKLVSEPNYHTTKHFSENVSVIDMKKTKVIMNKLVYLGMSILDISKTLMYEFWYYYYDENDKRLLPIGKNKKVIGLFKDELGGKIMEEFCALRAKTDKYLLNGYNDNDYDKEKIINKKAKGTKSV